MWVNELMNEKYDEQQFTIILHQAEQLCNIFNHAMTNKHKSIQNIKTDGVDILRQVR